MRSFAGSILAASLQLDRVVDLLVDMAAIEAGRVRSDPRPVQVRELLEPGSAPGGPASRVGPVT